MTITGTIFSIQRFSIHDGPGIRTTVFLKGCPLRCFWCHNPEGLRAGIEIQFYSEKCIQCETCATVCERGAHRFLDGMHLYDRDLCDSCGKCAAECCSLALQAAGQRVTPEYVIQECLRDKAFYDGDASKPSGGVTLSGGEPLLQPVFARAVLEGLRAEGVQTAIETTAYFPWSRIEPFLPLLDLVMMDLKHFDSEKHQQATGVPNERILKNARRLGLTGIPLAFHTPVVPTVNDTPDEIGAIARFVAEIQAERPAGSQPIRLELLPFHKLAADKYRSLGMEYRAASLDAPKKERLAELLQTAQAQYPEVICR